MVNRIGVGLRICLRRKKFLEGIYLSGQVVGLVVEEEVFDLKGLDLGFREKIWGQIWGVFYFRILEKGLVCFWEWRQSGLLERINFKKLLVSRENKIIEGLGEFFYCFRFIIEIVYCEIIVLKIQFKWIVFVFLRCMVVNVLVYLNKLSVCYLLRSIKQGIFVR